MRVRLREGSASINASGPCRSAVLPLGTGLEPVGDPEDVLACNLRLMRTIDSGAFASIDMCVWSLVS